MYSRCLFAKCGAIISAQCSWEEKNHQCDAIEKLKLLKDQSQKDQLQKDQLQIDQVSKTMISTETKKSAVVV